jgi:hypothetical protein
MLEAVLLSVIAASVVALRTSPEWAYQGLEPTVKNVFYLFMYLFSGEAT